MKAYAGDSEQTATNELKYPLILSLYSTLLLGYLLNKKKILVAVRIGNHPIRLFMYIQSGS